MEYKYTRIRCTAVRWRGFHRFVRKQLGFKE